MRKLLLFSIFFGLGSTGCTKFNSLRLNNSASLSRVTGADAVSGAAKYTQNCQGCHGTLDASNKRGAAASVISAAIAGRIPQMKTLAFLSTQDIADISAALDVGNQAPPGPPPTGPVSLSRVSVPMGGRTYLSSAMTNLFGTDSTIQNVIQQNILQHPEVLGGRCSVYEDNCPSTGPVAFVFASSSVMRQGLMGRTCDEILQYDGSVTTLLSKAQIAPTDPITDSNLAALYGLFNVGRAANANSITALKKLYDFDTSRSGLDRWRFVAAAICASAGFQSL